MSSRRRGAVLAYHAIGECSDDRHNLFVAEDAFEKQMSYLAGRHEVVPLADLVTGRHVRRGVAITFDDAYESVFDTAVPILERHGFAATVFVPTAHIGSRNSWDPPSDCPLDIAPAETLVAAAQRGIAIESHGHMHIDMFSADVGEARSDLARSMEVLEALLGAPPRFLAYPFRTAPETVRGVAKELGFEAAFSIDCPHEGRLAYERVQVTALDGLAVFALKASGRFVGIRNSPFGRAAALVSPRRLRRRSP